MTDPHEPFRPPFYYAQLPDEVAAHIGDALYELAACFEERFGDQIRRHRLSAAAARRPGDERQLDIFRHDDPF